MVFTFTYLLRFNLVSSAVDIPKMGLQLLATLPFFILGAALFKPYNGILRHSSVSDAISIVQFLTFGTAGMALVSFLGYHSDAQLVIPLSVLVPQYFITGSILVGTRYVITHVYHNLVKKPVSEHNIMIFGAGSMGMITKSVIEKDETLRYNLIGFIDDNPAYHQKRIDGLMVYSPTEAFGKIMEEKEVKEVVIGITASKLTKERKSEIVDLCIQNNIRVKELPESKQWLNGKFFSNQIQDVQIEDLLGRDPIMLDNCDVNRGVYGKKIMVTGAAGSIGSEIIRQLVRLFPDRICMVDQSESALYDLHNEVSAMKTDTQLIPVVADLTDNYRMRRLFETCTPDIIFHAAAYKHVPMMEDNPYEALRNNVRGTKILADLAVEFRVKKFVMVSTDKAVNPTNVMGATKRICEMYTQSLGNQSGCRTQFITTRFGNVLGSNGSVIPLFKKQISQGGPVTVTDRKIIRYFMTIPEACRLVLEAGFMGKGGEIFLFDMGKPVKIYDLAEKMIRLSGFTPHKDIQILETGLRPGEKLYEELLANREEHLPTHHEKIMIGKFRSYDYPSTLFRINELLTHLTLETEEELVMRMKEIVPEFISQNSRFEKLDRIMLNE